MSNNDVQDNEVENVEDELETQNVELVQAEDELPPEDSDEGEEVLRGGADIEDEIEAESIENVDKVEEYFRLKGVIRTLRNDLKDTKIQMEQTEELEKLSKKIKELREEVKANETVRTLTEKIATSKERMELLKELIRIELLESAQEEIKRNGRKLKLVNILREMKDEGKEKKQANRKFFR